MIEQRPRSSGLVPVDMTTFVGRTREVGQAECLLDSARLVTLTGVGGVGKSRLALRVASDLAVNYLDGAVLAKLDAIDGPALFTLAVADALGLANGDGLDAIIRDLRDKNMLLLLDARERFTPACCQLVSAILAEAPDVRVLATSRSPLRLPGERVLRVLPFPVPEVGDPVAASELDAVRLFADRAAAELSGFGIGGENWENVVRLCQRLDGIPLAIELGAAWLRVVPLDEILSRMDNRFQFLVRAPKLVPPRQRSLLAAVVSSYDLCDTLEKLLWERLSVFGETFDQQALEVLCAGGDIARADIAQLVSGLLEESILTVEKSVLGKRFRLAETFREFGRIRQRESGDDIDLLVRHSEYFTRLLEREEARWRRGQDQFDVSERVRIELGNINVALEFCLNTPGQESSGLYLALLMNFYWLTYGGSAAGLRWIELALARNPQPSKLRALGLLVSSTLATHQGMTPGLRLPRQAEAWALANGDDAVLAYARLTIAFITCQLGDLEQGLPLLIRAAEMQMHVDSGITDYLGSQARIGEVQVALGMRRAAFMTAENALALIDEDASVAPAAQKDLLRFLGSAGVGDLARAETSLQMGLRIAHRLHDTCGTAQLVERLAWWAADQGKYAWAAELLGISERTLSWTGPGRNWAGSAARNTHDQQVLRVRGALGDAAYQAALARGTEYGDGIGEVLKCAGRPGASARRPARPALLTDRERQVARLVAEGLTNREIATRLAIAQRTAETHVDRILHKLGLASRHQLAAYDDQ